jgi:glycosyltransferase involved in cell wall biosynthesis
MSNPYLYILTPLIKKYFPCTAVVDIIHCHNARGELSWLDLSSYYSNQIDARIVVADTIAKILSERFSEDPSKILVLANQVKTRKASLRLQAKGLNPTKNKAIPSGNQVIGFLGRLAHQKQPVQFVKLAESFSEDSNLTFLMGGTGELADEISKLARGSKNIIQEGHVRDVTGFLKSCDIVVFFSLFEGMPLVMLECASLGVPVIAPNIIGFREAISKGGFGLLYDPSYNGKDFALVKSIIDEHGIEAISRLGGLGPKYIQDYHLDYCERHGLENIFQEFVSLASAPHALREAIATYHSKNSLI